MHRDLVRSGHLADRVRVQAGDGQPSGRFWNGHRPGLSQDPGEGAVVRRTDQHVCATVLADERVKRCVADKAAVTDNDQMVGCQRHLADRENQPPNAGMV